MITSRVKSQARSEKNKSGALKLIIVVLISLYGLLEYLDKSLRSLHDDFFKSVRVGIVLTATFIVSRSAIIFLLVSVLIFGIAKNTCKFPLFQNIGLVLSAIFLPNIDSP